MPFKIINEKKFKSLPKAIIFDTDNTLYSYAPANELALKSVFSKAETLLDINRNLFEEKFKEARLEIKKESLTKQVLIVDYFIFREQSNFLGLKHNFY